MQNWFVKMSKLPSSECPAPEWLWPLESPGNPETWQQGGLLWGPSSVASHLIVPMTLGPKQGERAAFLSAVCFLSGSTEEALLVGSAASPGQPDLHNVDQQKHPPFSFGARGPRREARARPPGPGSVGLFPARSSPCQPRRARQAPISAAKSQSEGKGNVCITNAISLFSTGLFYIIFVWASVPQTIPTLRKRLWWCSFHLWVIKKKMLYSEGPQTIKDIL